MAHSTTWGTRSGVCVRSRVARMRGTADCMPKETRVKPASAKARRSCLVTVSGLASRVTSAPSSIPTRVRSPSRIAISSAASSIVGVPPPKNTVRAARSGSPASAMTRVASEASARTDGA